MTRLKPFDLMDHKPALDFDTLNFVWDKLWRHNLVRRATNQYTRARKDEQESIIVQLEELAIDVLAKAVQP